VLFRSDTLRGGQGNDSITGGAGIDMLSGDMGVDSLRGGAGADRFLFTAGAARLVDGGLDVIADFENGSDRISLDFQVTSVLGGGREGNFAGAASSAQQLLDRHGGNAEVAAISVGSDTYLFFAGDGGDTVDSAIRLMGISPTAIDGRDFV
jgi:Ca2+-binding RTX toxin-like protein